MGFIVGIEVKTQLKTQCLINLTIVEYECSFESSGSGKIEIPTSKLELILNCDQSKRTHLMSVIGGSHINI